MVSGAIKGHTHRKMLKPLCKHDGCIIHRREGSDYCEAHEPLHRTAAVVETGTIRIDRAMLTAGRAFPRRRHLIEGIE